MRYYHGTSYECYQKIIEFGFGTTTEETVWNCSDPTDTYVWSEFNLEDENEAWNMAGSNAQLTAAKYGSLSGKIVIFEFDFPDELVDDYVRCDDSCENMYDARAIDSDWLNNNIENGTIKVSIYTLLNGYDPDFRWFFLASCNEELLSFTNDEYRKYQLAGSLCKYSIIEDFFIPDRSQSEWEKSEYCPVDAPIILSA